MDTVEYNEHSMNATVSRIETKLDMVLKAYTDQNRRLAILEMAENKRAGVIATVGFLCGVIGAGATLFVEYIKGK